MPAQTTSTLLMVRPTDFAFNEQTAKDNEFQQKTTGGDIRSQVLAEFEQAVSTLRSHGIEVLVVEKESGYPEMPDAVFPNNWFGTDEEGNLHVFPMKTPNRKAETSQFAQVCTLLNASKYSIKKEFIWENILGDGAVLEGTGSLIFDKENKVVYAAISERTQKNAAQHFAEKMGYEPILFQTLSSKGFPYYHTNVVMSIGEKMAVVCLECIPSLVERETVRHKLSQTHQLITISKEQLEQNYCGNILQVKNASGQVFTVMSQLAFDGFSEKQKEQLSAFGTLLPIAIPTIEKIGGGSIRCMMAEIFNPKN